MQQPGKTSSLYDKPDTRRCKCGVILTLANIDARPMGIMCVGCAQKDRSASWWADVIIWGTVGIVIGFVLPWPIA